MHVVSKSSRNVNLTPDFYWRSGTEHPGRLYLHRGQSFWGGREGGRWCYKPQGFVMSSSSSVGEEK